MNSRITNITREADGVRTYVLDTDLQLKYLPGQWMNVRLGEAGKRQFTISASPSEKNIAFTTRYSESDFKKRLWSLKKGDRMETEGVMGNFCMNKKLTGPQLFICAGTGVTPFRSMYKYMFDRQISSDVILLYADKDRNRLIFEQELRNIARNRSNLEVKFLLSDEKHPGYIHGRIDSKTIKANVEDYEDRTWWVCGSTTFVDSVLETAKKMQIKHKVLNEDYPTNG